MIQQPPSVDTEGDPAAVGMTHVPSVDAWVWACVAIALLALRVYPNFVPGLEHDSFPYLSAAENALKGHFGYTSLIHFDAERSFGVIPAPMVTFPAGYPMAIALVSLMGVSLERAAFIVSAVSTVACVPLLAWLAGQLGLSRLLRNGVVASFVLNGVVIRFGTTIMTEALFAFLILLGVALLVRARLRADSSRWWPWGAAGLVFGAAYFVRYAGLFLVAGLAILVVRHLRASNRSLAIGHGVALAAAGGAVLSGMARNFLLVGNWRGRDEMNVSNPVVHALVKALDAANLLFLGPNTHPPGGTFPLKALFGIFFLAGVGWLTWSYLRHRDVRVGDRPALKGTGVDLLLLAASYMGGMFYVGLTSSISFGSPRNFVPVAALVVLLFGLMLQTMLTTLPQASPSRRVSLFALGGGFFVCAWLNLLVARVPPADRVSVVAERLDSIAGDGRSARSAVLNLVGPQQVIVANNGQAVGYVLGRPTVSLVGPTFSEMRWSEAAMRDVVRRFHPAAIVISAPIAGQPETDDLPSPFVRQLAQGDAPPWMKLVFRSRDHLVYEPQ